MHPAFIVTPMLEAMPPKAFEVRMKSIPLGRCNADDAAGLVLFLLSDDSSYTTEPDRDRRRTVDLAVAASVDQQAAVKIEDLAGDESGKRGDQEGDAVGAFLRLAEAADGYLPLDRLKRLHR